jgi:hypothetical protein
VEKYRRAGQATDENMAHVHCMLDNCGYKNSHRLCNNYCFSTASVITGSRMNVICTLLVWLLLVVNNTNKAAINNTDRHSLLAVCFNTLLSP